MGGRREAEFAGKVRMNMKIIKLKADPQPKTIVEILEEENENLRADVARLQRELELGDARMVAEKQAFVRGLEAFLNGTYQSLASVQSAILKTLGDVNTQNLNLSLEKMEVIRKLLPGSSGQE